MNRRLDERFPAQLHVKMTDLVTEECAAGRLADLSNSGLCVVVDRQFAAGTILELEIADSIMFGSVVHCTGEHTPFRIGIEVIRVLLGGTDLAKLLKVVLVEVLPQTRGLITSTFKH